MDSHILKDDFTKSAHVHAVELGLKEAVFTDNSKCHGIQQLLEINFGYRIFNNHFREEKQDKRMYETKIIRLPK
ncbi:MULTISPECIES: hypothetical protein [unclassified Sphingobacterium]|uniref:hypothetical protein n=1 Tax=unclassified Sphingobacterium TaxID=2609468 RepID=UPI00104F802E|nr:MULTISPECIES: hypothetical protein [unclassified Sphingobacterium]MCS3552639.1 hypothetical protein [Sphingobacterium sp. JUb21]